MDLGLYIAASGMVAEQVRQDQLANDLANASTPGFKPDESPQHSFGEVLMANTEGGAAVGSVDEGVALGKTYTNMTPGSMQETGEPLDFAIEGNGFFAVKTAQGVRYTRDGQFTTSAAGVLTDASGDPVLEPERRADQGRRQRHGAGERGRRLRSARARSSRAKTCTRARPPASRAARCARARSRARASTPPRRWSK